MGYVCRPQENSWTIVIVIGGEFQLLYFGLRN